MIITMIITILSFSHQFGDLIFQQISRAADGNSGGGSGRADGNSGGCGICVDGSSGGGSGLPRLAPSGLSDAVDACGVC